MIVITAGARDGKCWPEATTRSSAARTTRSSRPPQRDKDAPVPHPRDRRATASPSQKASRHNDLKRGLITYRAK